MDCNACEFCLDKKKNGGPGLKRKACLYKQRGGGPAAGGSQSADGAGQHQNQHSHRYKSSKQAKPTIDRSRKPTIGLPTC